LKRNWKKSQPFSGPYPSTKVSSSAGPDVMAAASSVLSILQSRTFLYYTLIPAILLSIIMVLSTDLRAWHLSEIHHFYIELFAVILGSILAFYYIARAHTLKDNFSRFVGFGFLASALIDLLHVGVSFAYSDNAIFLKYFIPQTWFAGRIILSAMLVIAITKYPTFSGEEKDTNYGVPETETRTESELKGKNEAEYKYNKGRTKNPQSSSALIGPNKTSKKSDRAFLTYLIILSVLAGTVAISSLYFILPYSVVDNIPLHRPYELPSCALFIIALVLFYKNELYKKTDVFYKGILVYLIIDIYAQIIMSYSATSFDTPHMVAHVLKDAGYFVNIIALALSSIQYNVRLRESNKSLIESNVRLKEREEIIRIQYDKVKESEKMKDEFINTAAHELRTPIQPIIGMAESIRSRIVSLDGKSARPEGDGNNVNEERSGQLLGLLDVITRNARRLKQLTDNILDVTKIESHALKLSRVRADLRELIAETVNDQKVRMSDSINVKTSIQIFCMGTNKEIEDTSTAKIEYPNTAQKESHESNDNNDRLQSNPVVESFIVNVDKIKISQVISNLLSNALTAIRLKNHGEEGRINILISRSEKKKYKTKVNDNIMATAENAYDTSFGDEIIVNIKDNGIGIPPSIIPNLFAKFISGSDAGTGLGLFISKNIIEAHGGRIWACNNGATEGTAASSGATFSFSLPAL
jgi:signal transduction histidine kinase